uniref:Tetraspanin n=1 Tax=Arion vulgaris TaxID=1028688 RepID=A0A0B7AHA2_9EUPU
MTSSNCVTISKYVLVLTGIIYLITAGGLSYIGIWVFSTYDHYDAIADAFLMLLPAGIIMGVSAVMCVIGILACLAACKTSKTLLSVFFCLILIVLVCEVVTGSLGYIYRNKAEDILEDDLMDAINNYNVTVYREQIDYMQQEFSCCGVHNATDWQVSTFWKLNHRDTVPPSCCIGNLTVCNQTVGSVTTNFKGCLVKLTDEFNDSLIYIACAAISLALVQLMALISTCILICRTKDELNYKSLSEETGRDWRV